MPKTIHNWSRSCVNQGLIKQRCSVCVSQLMPFASITNSVFNFLCLFYLFCIECDNIPSKIYATLQHYVFVCMPTKARLRSIPHVTLCRFNFLINIWNILTIKLINFSPKYALINNNLVLQTILFSLVLQYIYTKIVTFICWRINKIIIRQCNL